MKSFKLTICLLISFFALSQASLACNCIGPLNFTFAKGAYGILRGTVSLLKTSTTERNDFTEISETTERSFTINITDNLTNSNLPNIVPIHQEYTQVKMIHQVSLCDCRRLGDNQDLPLENGKEYIFFIENSGGNLVAQGILPLDGQTISKGFDLNGDFVNQGEDYNVFKQRIDFSDNTDYSNTAVWNRRYRHGPDVIYVPRTIKDWLSSSVWFIILTLPLIILFISYVYSRYQTKKTTLGN